MIKKILVVVVLINNNINCNSDIFLSNRSIQGKVFVYDHNTNKSLTLNGYENGETNNGECVKIASSNKPITLIFEEDVSDTNLFHSSCNVNSFSQGIKNGTTPCPALIGTPVIFNQTYIYDNNVNYGSSEKSPKDVMSSDSFSLPSDAYGSSLTPGSGTSIPISYICQDLAAYILGKWATGSEYKIAELINSDPNKKSFCSITFTPEKGTTIGLKPNMLFSENHTVPASCKLKNNDRQAECRIAIKNTNPFSGQKESTTNCTYDMGNKKLTCFKIDQSNISFDNSSFSTSQSGYSTFKFKIKSSPNYNCTFTCKQNENTGNCEYLTQGYCSFPSSIAIIDSFGSCGFCSQFNTQTVSGNSVTSSLEDSDNWGEEGLIYPFKSSGTIDCSNGFIANIG